MIRILYRLVLRLPLFRGRHRIDALFRRFLEEPIETLPDGIKMRLDPQEWMQVALLSRRPTEPITARRSRTLLSAGDVFIDVGAHVGWLSLIGAQKVGSSGCVIAVDPQPYNCERILTNALLNEFHNIFVVRAALSDFNGYHRVAQQQGTDKSRLTLDGAGVNDTGQQFLVPCFRLDSLLRLVEMGGRVKVLKIDVEGHELRVLQGARDVMERVDNVIFEVLPSIDHSAPATLAVLLLAAGVSN